MAYIDARFAAPGTALDIDVRGRLEPFTVVPLPFYKRPRS
jgi:aminomethyltransferase